MQRHRSAPTASPSCSWPGSTRPLPAALLDQRLGDAPAPEVTERLIAESGGNPLALLELPTELSPDQLGGSSPLPAQLHLTTRVEQAFLDRSRLLPPPVQSVLLLAAADDTGELAVVRRAASTLGLGEQALEAAVASGLLIAEAGLGEGASPARPLGGLPGRHRRATTYGAPGAGRRLGRSRRLRPRSVASRRRRRRARPEPSSPLSSVVGSRAERRGGYAAAMTAYERAAALSARGTRSVPR